MRTIIKQKKKVFLLVFVFILIILGIAGIIINSCLFTTSCLFQKDKPTIVGAIPNDWKKFTGIDTDFGVQTTISLPPECNNFTFSGSEWDLDCGANDKWDYANSVYRGNDEENPTNHYLGEPLKDWYQQYIDQDKILTVKEHPLNEGYYLEMLIKLAYNGKTETNYLYVQNNILHFLRPLVVDESNSIVKKNIGIIFSSLESIIIK